MRTTDDPCRIHASVLAALEDYEELRLDLATDEAVADARAHLATCARCQARARTYARLDDALRATARAWMTQSASAFSTADLLAAIGADHEPRERRVPMLSVVTMRDEDDMDDENQTPPTQPGEDGERAQPRPTPAPAFAPLPTLKPTQPRQPAWRRALTGLVAVAAVAALVGGIVGAMNLSARSHNETGGKSTTTATQTAQANQANQPFGGPYYHIAALSMDSPTDGFAVMFNSADNNGDNIILHISNGVVTKQTTLRAPNFSPVTLQALSPTNVWLMFMAGGLDNLYHYDGKGWMLIHLPAPANANGNTVVVVALAMVSPTEGYAIGQYNVTQSTSSTTSIGVAKLAYYHYDGSTWRQDPADQTATKGGILQAGSTPDSTAEDDIQISGISATTGGDVWVTGWVEIGAQNGVVSGLKGFIYHRAGGVWRLAQSTPDVQYQGVAMVSPSRGWIIGTATKTTKVQAPVAPYTVTSQDPVALAWDGARWSPARVPSPTQTQNGMQFGQIVTSGSANAWLLGPSNSATITADKQYASETDYLAHFDGARWKTIALPQIAAINPNHNPILFNQASFNLAATTSAGDLWLAGNQVVDMGRGAQQPLLYHYAGGQWTSVALPAFK